MQGPNWTVSEQFYTLKLNDLSALILGPSVLSVLPPGMQGSHILVPLLLTLTRRYQSLKCRSMVISYHTEGNELKLTVGMCQ
jgi:hypothetical protein